MVSRKKSEHKTESDPIQWTKKNHWEKKNIYIYKYDRIFKEQQSKRKYGKSLAERVKWGLLGEEEEEK